VEIALPATLNSKTRVLVKEVAEALALKLLKAEQKYGFTDGWAEEGWDNECREKLLAHLYKGDPLDVIAYSSFLWYHGQPTVKLETN